MARYESDFTLFMKDLKQKNPEMEQGQRDGRARLWDKPQDPALQRQFDAAQITKEIVTSDETQPAH